MLRKEFEDVVANKVLIGGISDAEDIGNTERVELDRKIGISDNQILCKISAGLSEYGGESTLEYAV